MKVDKDTKNKLWVHKYECIECNEVFHVEEFDSESYFPLFATIYDVCPDCKDK